MYSPASSSKSFRFRRVGPVLQGLSILIFISFSALASATKVSHLTESSLSLQWERFLRLEDRALVYALTGAIFTGLSTGILGSFLVVRRLAMVGDTLSHAVLPGLVAGFLWAGGKDPWALFVGACLAGLLGNFLVTQIRNHSLLKEDAALGLVLSGFYAIGITLLTMLQHSSIGQKAGLDKVLFGQAAALGVKDLQLMGIASLVLIMLLAFFYKEFLTLSFDKSFARALGYPVRFLEGLFMGILAATVVLSLQASGIVLVSAMLIIPASTAYLLSCHFPKMLAISAGLSILSGLFGALLSFLKAGLPTGPCMVVVAACFFFIAWLLGPRQGLIQQSLRRARHKKRVSIENTLKSIYHLLEYENFKKKTLTLKSLAKRQNQGLQQVEREVYTLVKKNLALWSAPLGSCRKQRTSFQLTTVGWAKACEIVRKHRLWELYLTHAANYAADHVHDDAEKIEHIIGERAVQEIEKRLNYPQKDPHGKLIPSLADLERPYYTRAPWNDREQEGPTTSKN